MDSVTQRDEADNNLYKTPLDEDTGAAGHITVKEERERSHVLHFQAWQAWPTNLGIIVFCNPSMAYPLAIGQYLVETLQSQLHTALMINKLGALTIKAYVVFVKVLIATLSTTACAITCLPLPNPVLLSSDEDNQSSEPDEAPSVRVSERKDDQQQPMSRSIDIEAQVQKFQTDTAPVYNQDPEKALLYEILAQWRVCYWSAGHVVKSLFHLIVFIASICLMTIPLDTLIFLALIILAALPYALVGLVCGISMKISFLVRNDSEIANVMGIAGSIGGVALAICIGVLAYSSQKLGFKARFLKQHQPEKKISKIIAFLLQTLFFLVAPVLGRALLVFTAQAVPSGLDYFLAARCGLFAGLKNSAVCWLFVLFWNRWKRRKAGFENST